jgi:hypothetical protein
MEKIKVTILMLMEFVSAWRNLKNSGLSFKAAGLMEMGFNYQIISGRVQAYEAAQEDSDDYKKYQDEMGLLKLSLQAPVKENGPGVSSYFADGQKAAVEIKALNDKHRTVIDEYEKRKSEYEKMQLKEIEIEITRIPFSDVILKSATEKDGKITDVPDAQAPALGAMMFCIKR